MNDQHTATAEQVAALELDHLFAEHRRAQQKLEQARRDVEQWERAERIAALRYKRQALWIKADELRKQLAATENEAASIRLED